MQATAPGAAGGTPGVFARREQGAWIDPPRDPRRRDSGCMFSPGDLWKPPATQMLFLQHVIDALRPGGRCKMVIDEGVLFRTTESAFVQAKRKSLDETDLWCIVSLPPGVFSSAGAGVKTNLLFFGKGGPTQRTWYFDLSDVKVTKKQPMTLDRFNELFALAGSRADSPRSWTVGRDELETRGYDFKAVNPTAKATGDTPTPTELLEEIEARGREVDAAIVRLRALLGPSEPEEA
jgi:type I restriction enzyme M protein